MYGSVFVVCTHMHTLSIMSLSYRCLVSSPARLEHSERQRPPGAPYSKIVFLDIDSWSDSALYLYPRCLGTTCGSFTCCFFNIFLGHLACFSVSGSTRHHVPNYVLRVIPTVAYMLRYTLTFHLTFYLAFYVACIPTFYLTFSMQFYLTCILTFYIILSDSIWHIFWLILTFYLTFCSNLAFWSPCQFTPLTWVFQF